MRICSLVPGATEVVAALDLTDRLAAVSHECDYPESIRHVPSVVESVNERWMNSTAFNTRIHHGPRRSTQLARQPATYILDADAYFSRPGPRRVDGIELLAIIFHPMPSHHLNPTQAVRLTTSLLSAESRA